MATSIAIPARGTLRLEHCHGTHMRNDRATTLSLLPMVHMGVNCDGPGVSMRLTS